MRTFISIYSNCIKTAFAQAAAYRLNFVLLLFITLAGNILFPLVTILIYNSGASFPGWTFYEVLLIQSIFVISDGLAILMFGGVLWTTMEHVREGSFEIVLLKPLNPLFFMISTNFEAENLGLVIGGIIMFTIAVVNTGVASVISVGQFLLLFAAGFAVMTGMIFLMAATSFKWVGNSRIPEMYESVTAFGKYPASIFPKFIQRLTAFVIPVSMIGFLPAQALLGNVDALSLIAVIPCGLFLLFGIRVYLRMVRHYEGVGG